MHDLTSDSAAAAYGAVGREYTPRERMFSLAAVVACAFGIGLSFGVGFPLTSLTLEAWQAEKWVIGLSGAAPALAVLIVLPFAPRILSRLSFVAAISVGCLIGAAGFILLSQCTTPAAWIALRFAMSMGLALPWLAGETWINLVTREETRGRVIAAYAIAFFSGFALGPQILAWTGLTGMAPFAVGAAASACAGVPILLAARLAPGLSHAGDTGMGGALRLAPVGMAGAFLGGFAEMTYLALLPNVALAGGLDQTRALLLTTMMTLGGVILQFPIGWLADKAPRVAVTIALSVAFVALSLALPLALPLPSAAALVVFLLGGVILGFYTVGLAIVGEQVPARQLASANAAFLIMYQIGAIIGPLAAGAAMTVSPVTGFVLLVSGGMAVITAALVWLARRTA
ncbi:MAG: MFS transporter [Hyphomicrobium sp.]